VPALPSSVLDPLWVQVAALLPTPQVRHPLGCHRPRIADRVVFDKLIQVLVLAVGIAASPTTPARRPPCAAAGTSGSAPGWPKDSAWRCWPPMTSCSAWTWSTGGGHLHHQGTLRRPDRRASPVDRRKQGRKRSVATEASGIPLATLPARPTTATMGCWPPPSTPWRWSGRCPPSQSRTWTPATTTSLAARF
jgi:hypothetical protein